MEAARTAALDGGEGRHNVQRWWWWPEDGRRCRRGVVEAAGGEWSSNPGVTEGESARARSVTQVRGVGEFPEQFGNGRLTGGGRRGGGVAAGHLDRTRGDGRMPAVDIREGAGSS